MSQLMKKKQGRNIQLKAKLGKIFQVISGVPISVRNHVSLLTDPNGSSLLSKAGLIIPCELFRIDMDNSFMMET